MFLSFIRTLPVRVYFQMKRQNIILKEICRFIQDLGSVRLCISMEMYPLYKKYKRVEVFGMLISSNSRHISLFPYPVCLSLHCKWENAKSQTGLMTIATDNRRPTPSYRVSSHLHPLSTYENQVQVQIIIAQSLLPRRVNHSPRELSEAPVSRFF